MILVSHVLLIVIIKLLLAKRGSPFKEALGKGVVLPLNALDLSLPIHEVEAANSTEALVSLLYLD